MSNERYAAPADEFPRKGNSGNGSTTGYSVEARYAYDSPLVVGDITLDLRWRTIHFPQGSPGVPERAAWEGDPIRYGLHTWAAAEALRWWFVAEVEAAHRGHFCLETRIVEHHIKYNYSVEAVGATEAADLRYGNRFPSRKAPADRSQQSVSEPGA